MVTTGHPPTLWGSVRAGLRVGLMVGAYFGGALFVILSVVVGFMLALEALGLIGPLP